ncbi:MAG: Holliday junction resolvase RuvX [bacterium]|nr:MAG: Holliday junction resolvase RuvX [bacterium]
MGIDWGERRIGIALSDESRTIASPHGVVVRTRSLSRDLEEICRMIRVNSVEQVVIGMPIRLNGSTGEAAQEVLGVADTLRAMIELPVETWDERLSTAEAERALIGGDVSRRKRKDLLDRVAAAIFLQAYLDRHRETLRQDPERREETGQGDGS